MNNVLLGKTVKAMYKQSGKTIPELSEITGLSVDTINNIFYARLISPGFNCVSLITEACGFSMSMLDGFLKHAEKIPSDVDITEEFSKYIAEKDDELSLIPSLVDTTVTEKENTAESAVSEEPLPDFYKEMSLRYLDQLNQLKESQGELKAHYEHSVTEIRKMHDRELARENGIIATLRKVVIILSILVLILAVSVFLLALFGPPPGAELIQY